jgi:hypothetical protein
VVEEKGTKYAFHVENFPARKLRKKEQEQTTIKTKFRSEITEQTERSKFQKKKKSYDCAVMSVLKQNAMEMFRQ